MFKNRRRRRLREQPFPAAWRKIIDSDVPLFARLPVEDQAELLGATQILLAEKSFEGCGGLTLTDEMRVTIAAQAAILLLHRDTDYYPRLTAVLIYPSTYMIPSGSSGGIWHEGNDVVLGHTAPRLGALALAWDATLRGARNDHDGENVVLHEFAHQLDFEDFVVDGTPPLDSRTEYASWVRVFAPAFKQLQHERDAGHHSFLNHYGATNPAEFFAVVTETFFERPREFLAHYPKLYEELRAFYRQDPARWEDARGADRAAP